ncbi:MAG: hypothetical protein SFV51_32075 [Bryobacteraceae bacterium]|nr:hypothetical protein [Bryobacteraceae bacterium]
MRPERILLALPLAACAFAQSAWLPPPRKVVLTPAFVYQGFDRFWMGGNRATLSDPVRQRSLTLGVEYGISRKLAADFTAGYTGTRTTAFGGNGTDTGMTDTLAGIRYRLVDEAAAGSRWLPTIAARIGVIAGGSYRPNYPFSAGDGASGGEISLLLGKAFSDAGLGAYGDIGFRKRARRVPDDLFGSAGIYKTVKKVSLSAGYRQASGLSGMDIGDSGFTFPRLKEIVKSLELGLGFTGKGVYYQLFSAHALGGRNTGAKLVVGVSASFSFDAKR